MARSAAVLLTLLAYCGLAAAQNYSSLAPPAYTVTLSYTLSGVLSSPAPCLEFDPKTSTCLPQVNVQNKDSITITYSGPLGPAGNTVNLMTCFSNTSAINRAWRKANPLISKDKKCNVASPFAKGLPTGPNTYTWTLGENTPQGTYQIQLLELVAGSDPKKYAAMGKSVGFFQVIPIDDRPAWLMAMVGVFCCIGPIVLAGFFTYEKIYKKD